MSFAEAAAAEKQAIEQIAAIGGAGFASAMAQAAVGGSIEVLKPPVLTVRVEVILVVEDIPDSPAPATGGSKKSDSTGAVVGGVIGGLVAVICCVAGFFMYKRKQKGYKQTAVTPA